MPTWIDDADWDHWDRQLPKRLPDWCSRCGERVQWHYDDADRPTWAFCVSCDYKPKRNHGGRTGR